MYGSGSDGSGSKRFHGLHGSDGSGSHGSGSIRISVPPVPVRDGSYSFDGSGASISNVSDGSCGSGSDGSGSHGCDSQGGRGALAVRS